MLREDELKRINIMLDKPLLKEIDTFAKMRKEDRSTAIRQLLLEKLVEEKVDLAIEKFESGNITFRDAASLADLDYWDFQFELEKRGIPIMRDITLAERRLKRALSK